MQRFKNWLLTVLMRKDRLVAVPESWQNDYVRMAGDEVHKRQTIATLVTEYNSLLKDYFNKCSVKELQDQLASGDVKFKTTMPKEELVNLAYEEFRMAIERN